MHKPLLTLSLLALAIQAHAGPIRPVVTATPEAGRYTSAQNVKLNVGSPSTVVYFTTDGSLPSKSSPRYQGEAIQVVDRTSTGNDMLIRTLTYDANGNGARHTFAYLIKGDNTAPVVTASVPAGSYPVEQSITLSVTDDQDKA
ncbi:MAG: chitobiase/beta-hexosaminidase C-terminal domain-containing protein, partial [Aeromonadaceae bacterium]